jgi:hypothetical protein
VGQLHTMKMWTVTKVERVLNWAVVHRNVVLPSLWLFIGLWTVGAYVWSENTLVNVHSPPTVSVRGYTRRDGSTVRPYNRRPPGVAAADERYNAQANASTQWIRNLITAAWISGTVGAGFAIWLILHLTPTPSANPPKRYVPHGKPRTGKRPIQGRL